MIKTLVADDHPGFRSGLCNALADTEDITVVDSCPVGEEAIEKSRKLSPDVVIISIDSPSANGIECCKQIREKCPNTKVIAISGYATGQQVIPVLRAGAMGYVLKTSLLDELITAVRNVHAGEVVFDSKASGKILMALAMDSDVTISQVEDLHEREMEVLIQLARGKPNKDIASILDISEHTVHAHLTNIFRKLGVNNRTEAILHAFRAGLIDFDKL
jgi:DNA-binding NarL/FixJ family response regulator